MHTCIHGLDFLLAGKAMGAGDNCACNSSGWISHSLEDVEARIKLIVKQRIIERCVIGPPNGRVISNVASSGPSPTEPN